MLEIVEGNLLEATEQYIAHNCNCVTNSAAGLAKHIFTKYPYADVYRTRESVSQPGTIQVSGNGIENRYVINMFTQYYPGISKEQDSNLDGRVAREKYFHQCLLKVSQLPGLKSIAFPFGIGCGLAGGNWDYYLGTLNNFANFVSKKYQTQVKIYRKI
jgi:O-acetyl-ADP-ribose deacetylase (regulator of RNase III)